MNIEQLSNDVQEIKDDLNKLSSSVLSQQEKEAKIQEIKDKANNTKDQLEKEMVTLSEEEKEKAQVLLDSLNEIINIQLSIVANQQTNNVNSNNESIQNSNVERLQELGIEISETDKERINKLNITDEDIQLIKDNSIETLEDVEFVLAIKNNCDRKVIQEYIQRKQEYLKNNRTLPEEKFNELFGEKGKYGKSEINQTDLNLCYAYSGFETFKKTNGFNEIIQTHLKETHEGREVKMPFLSKDGERIKVNKNEIDMKFIDGYGKEKCVNSKTSLGFKILEIAYIKKSIISDPKFNKERNDIRGKNPIEEARKLYKETGDIKLSSSLLKKVEWGKMTEFYELILGENCILPNQGERFHFEDPNLIFNGFNSGTLKVELGLSASYETNVIEGDLFLGRPKMTILENVKILGLEKVDNPYKFNSKTGEIEINNGIIFTKEGNIKIDGIEYGRISELSQEQKETFYKHLGNEGIEGNSYKDIVMLESGKYGVAIFERHAYSIERCYIDKNTGEKRIQFINPHHTEIKFDISLKDADSIFNRSTTGFNIDAMFR